MNDVHTRPFEKMGILNFTDNSYSGDGVLGDSSFFHKRLLEILESDAQILDVGAESTAPFNESICASVERTRLKSFCDFIEEVKFPRILDLSIDTYRPEHFWEVYERLQGHPSIGKIYFNDITGLYRDCSLELFKKADKAHYICGHTFLEKRKDTLHHHLSFTKSELPISELVNELIGHFKEVLSFFKREGLENRIAFDPCFGFSKSRTQCLDLLDQLPKLIEALPSYIPWVIGISRKSFLRPEGVSWQNCDQEAVEKSHQKWLKHWIQHPNLANHKMIFRVHSL